MKPLLALAIMLSLTGCLTNPSLRSEAGDLRASLASLPEVQEVTLDYSEPVPLDSGKLRLTVEMSTEAGGDEIVDVVTTTYEAFADTHRSEEGDLDVVLGEDTIHLRSFEPVAETESVARAAIDAASVLGSGTVRAEIMAQDIAADPHVETTYYVDVKGPGRGALLRKLGELERAHADIPRAWWRVQSGGEYGWLLEGASHGFPDRDQLDLFDRVSASAPRGVAIQMYDTDFVVAQVPAGFTPDQASPMARQHLEALGGAKKTFYHVESGPNFAVMMARGDCTFDRGPVGARLERDLGAECTKVTHPDDPD